MKKISLVLLALFIIISCNNKTESKSNIESLIEKPQAEIDANIALQFLNEYTELCNQIMLKKSSITEKDWIKKNLSVTEDFKNSYKILIENAEKEDPELGLGFDPIFDAQDYPDQGFEVLKIDTKNGYITFKAKDRSNFLLNLKVKLMNNKWLVDGAGVINIPLNNRIKH